MKRAIGWVRDLVVAAVVVAPCALSGCGLFQSVKPSGVYDLALELCQQYYGEHPKMNFTPKDACAIAEAVQPFVDQLLAAKKVAGARSSAAIGAHEP